MGIIVAKFVILGCLKINCDGAFASSLSFGAASFIARDSKCILLMGSQLAKAKAVFLGLSGLAPMVLTNVSSNLTAVGWLKPLRILVLCLAGMPVLLLI